MGRAGALNRSRSWRGGCGRPALARGRSARGGCPCPVQRSPGSGDDRACGGDRRRRPDRADVGGRAGVGGDRRRHRRTTRQSGSSTDREPGVFTPAPSRCSISVASRIGSSRRGRRCRSRVSPGSRWTSATSPPATTTGSRSGRATSSRILADWVSELGVPILRGREVVGFAQDDTGVDVELSDDQSLRAEYLVGCDGGRSVIRKAAGIDFPGLDPSTSWMIAEVEMDEEPEFGMRHDGGGIGPVGRAEDGEPVRGRAQRTTRRTHRRAHHAGSPRGTHRRVRDGLRGAQPDLDLPVHRHDAAGGVLPQGTCTAGRATPHTCIPRRAARASTPACRMP